jgi:hypothetical protein
MVSKTLFLKNAVLIVLSTAFLMPILRGQKTSSATNSTLLPMANSHIHYFESALYHKDSSHFTAIKPFIPSDMNGLVDSMHNALLLRGSFAETTWAGRKLLNEDFITVQGKDFSFNLNPVVNFTIGKDNQWADATPYVNTRGVRLTGNIKEKFTFESIFQENQGVFPKYLDDFIQKKQVVPGYGGFKPYATAKNGQDFANVIGGIAYQPNPYFHFSFGQGKHFWGEGYRSLLLSDNTPNYPYFRIVTTFWKIRYINLWAQLLDNNRTTANGSFTRKYTASHFLSYNVTKRFNIGLFETVVYHDSTGNRGLDINYMNPIIFYRPLEAALGSSAGNVMLGLNMKYKLTNNQTLYGQFILDEFNSQYIRDKWWANKFGYQIGLKSFNTLIKNLTIQTEYNWVRPYTYSHGVTFQNYGHYNQPLAHPLGSNFKEWVTRFRYHYNRFYTEGGIMLAQQGRDTMNINNGTDIYKSYNDNKPRETGVELLQGIKTKTLFGDIKIGFLVNPVTNLRFEIGANIRKITPEKELPTLKSNTTKYIYVGLKTDLFNYYSDF